MNNNNFTFDMQDSPFNSEEEITKQLIKEALDYVFEETILGNFNFFVLNNNDTFIQTFFEDGSWDVEISLVAGVVLEKNSLADSKVYSLFYDFFDSKTIDTASFQEVEL